MKKILELIINLIPKNKLPKAYKQVDGNIIQFTHKEVRNKLAEGWEFSIREFIKKISISRKVKKNKQKQRLAEAQETFYNVIGQITLVHAGVEQELQNQLIDEWLVPEANTKGKNKVTYMCGKKLQQRFLKEIEDRLIPVRFLEQYKEEISNFENLSEVRNDTLKAIYSFNLETSEISRINEEYRRHWMGKYKDMSHQEFIKKHYQSVTISELMSLLQNLTEVAIKLRSIHAHVWTEKLHLSMSFCKKPGDSMPSYASKLPYIYLKEIEE
jgi:hypothetical protein